MLFKGFDTPYKIGAKRTAGLAAFDLPFPLRNGDMSGVAEFDLDFEGEGMAGYGSSSELSTSHLVRSELYDSRLSNSSSAFNDWEFDEAGRVTRNERNFPAYVRVVDFVGGIIDSKDPDELEVRLDSSRALKGEAGRVGREGVRSNALIFS